MKVFGAVIVGLALASSLSVPFAGPEPPIVALAARNYAELDKRQGRGRKENSKNDEWDTSPNIVEVRPKPARWKPSDTYDDPNYDHQPYAKLQEQILGVDEAARAKPFKWEKIEYYDRKPIDGWSSVHYDEEREKVVRTTGARDAPYHFLHQKANARIYPYDDEGYRPLSKGEASANRNRIMKQVENDSRLKLTRPRVEGENYPNGLPQIARDELLAASNAPWSRATKRRTATLGLVPKTEGHIDGQLTELANRKSREHKKAIIYAQSGEESDIDSDITRTHRLYYAPEVDGQQRPQHVRMRSKTPTKIQYGEGSAARSPEGRNRGGRGRQGDPVFDPNARDPRFGTPEGSRSGGSKPNNRDKQTSHQRYHDDDTESDDDREPARHRHSPQQGGKGKQASHQRYEDDNEPARGWQRKRDFISYINSKEIGSGTPTASGQANTDANNATQQRMTELEGYAESLANAQINATNLLAPVINSLLNQTTNDIGYMMALDLYAMTDFSISVIGPFMGGCTTLDLDRPRNNGTSIEQHHLELLADALLMELYAGVWEDGIAAMNATGLLSDMNLLNGALAGSNESMLPMGYNSMTASPNLAFFFDQDDVEAPIHVGNNTILFTNSNSTG